jgi:hypothetical protein
LQKDWRLAWGEYIHEPDQRIAKVKDFPIADMIPDNGTGLTDQLCLDGVDYAAVLNIDSFPHEVPTWVGRQKHLLHVHDKTEKSCSGTACSALIYD